MTVPRMKTMFSVLVTSFALLMSHSMSFAQETKREPILKMKDILTKEQFAQLTTAEQNELLSELNEFNKNPYVQVADAGESDRMYGKAFCVGGKVAVIAYGFQGFRCLTTEKKSITITMSAQRYGRGLTGFIADGYVGINAGASLMVGVAILSAPMAEFEWSGRFDWGKPFYSPKEHEPDGVAINGALGLKGAYAGYYSRGNSSLTILAYQAGLAVEVGVSSVRID